MKLPRSERHYKATKGRLNNEFLQRPQNKGQPFSRPVLDSGTAVKTVYLSKAPQEYTHEDLAKALDHHEFKMRKEIQATGRIVRKVIKTIAGMEGDVRVQMLWEVLGVKPTKHVRRNRAKLSGYASALGPVEGSESQPGRAEAPADSQEGPVQI